MRGSGVLGKAALAVGALVVVAGLARGADEAAGPFAHTVHERVMILLFDAACIAPGSRHEDRARRQETVARQRELDAWFSDHGRRVSLADCTTPEDQENYHALRRTLAGARLLQLPVRERLAALDRMETYLRGFDNGFTDALAALGVNLADTGDPLTAHLLARLRIPPAFEARFFGRDESSRIGSMYFPPANLILLNLDVLCEAPEDFLDSIKHELWHHLLPIPPGRGFAGNLWWEGFNEAISETWADALRECTGSRAEWSRKVEYPVDTALAGLFLAADRVGALRYVAGIDGAEAFAARLRGGGVLGERLATILQTPASLDPSTQIRIEQLLHNWRWKADDGGRIRVTRLVADGRVSPAAVEDAFVQRRRFLMDFIQALSVVGLQDIEADRATRAAALAAAETLPRHLRKNVRTVFEYCRQPYYQMSNR
ncbi:MAG: hypothetical protein BWZ02_00445 [Lentisphaerae bacterium ADurb.BinA184]|nr:MAG: hypothetical protein BWZ02_00445 [Lentisphaerae bacterium ADurb.BinA184]